MGFLPKFLTGRPKEGFKPESWDDISTLDQFKSHAKCRLGGPQHIRSHEREYLELATAAQHGSSTKNETQCKSWGEHDLEKFLASKSPPELQPDFQIARPLIYRCMARMSAYPYLHGPELPEALTTEGMLAAVSILLQRPSWLGRPDSMATVDATVAEKHKRQFGALLFRSMRLSSHNRAPGGGKGQEKSGPARPRRSEQDDEDLRQVHLLLTRSRRYRSERFPTKLKSGPPIIAPEDLPSSYSTDLTGCIPRGEFEAFLRICMRLESGQQDVGPTAVEKSHCTTEVDWEEFEAILASSPVVNLDRLPMHLISEMGNQSSFVRGMTLLFSLLISPVEISGAVGENTEGKEQAGEDVDQTL
ncbi:hypothetical protein N0V93_008362 [Gnomoniopsis smithogilvyi]|uniref:Uncharacterized protein n=1 Tax=Gnomoniopsis smithogilvyi TaxID=1191159 RepID=A0A9W8YMJ8_9PEZI|nr:hypothetical protein N0V93_008362 [Gnomoniopsis smithogilvyi]